MKVDMTEADIACGQLASGAFFFVMWSCEYTKVSGEQQTKLLCLKNIRFYRDQKLMDHSHPELHLVDVVMITFTFQKNDEHDDTVPMHHTHDPRLCPVKYWASIVNHILSYPGMGPPLRSTPTMTKVNSKKSHPRCC